MSEFGPVLTDSLSGQPLIYSNEGGAFAYRPSCVTVQLSGQALRRHFGLTRRLRLLAPPGWSVQQPTRLVLDPSRAVVWRVQPAGTPASCMVNLTVIVERGDGRRHAIVQAVPIEIRARTQFDLDRHAFPFANAARETGDVVPSRATFVETYWRGAVLADAFFRGLYSQVVYLTADPDRRPGGLCTGIARSSIERSLTHPTDRVADQDTDTLRALASLWHGRQLADRALAASTLAWLRQGSRDAYSHFRERALRAAITDLAFDVNVPRPWRRDLLSALIGSGHTVVPYALRQASDDRADVWVYDPNYPHADEARRSVVRFDLARNSYSYRHYRGATPGQPSKVIAVDQTHYRAATTGHVGGLISVLLYPAAAIGSWWQRGWPASRWLDRAHAGGAMLGRLLAAGR